MTNLVYDVKNICTVRELIENSAEEFSQKVAFVIKNKDASLTKKLYCQVLDEVKYLATYLCSIGLEGKHIAIVGKNSYNWALSYLAVCCGVGVCVPVDKELKMPETKNILEMSDSDALIYSPEQREKIDECEFTGTKICMDSLEECIAKGKTLFENGDESYKNHKIDPFALGFLLYTSGTTGVAKGVMLSHYNICSDIVSARKYFYVGPEDRTISVLPLHHTYECTGGFLLMLYSGASICYCTSLLRLIDDFKEYKPTIFVAVPQMLKVFHSVIIKKISAVKGGKAFLNVGKTITTVSGKFAPSVAPVIFKSIHEAFGGNLKKILLGAAAVEPEIFKDFEKFGFKVYIGYGLTETSPVCVMHTDNARKADTVGYVVPGDKVKIVNPDANGVGELAVKGSNVMLGYYKDEENTKKVFDKDGYFLTGDLFCIDEQSGHYKIVGRLKNMIVTPNGKKIFPEEIEVLLSECEGVKECMAYGYTDETGDVVVAVKIFPDFDRLKALGMSDDESESSAYLQEHFLEIVKNKVNKRLPGYKAVKKVTVRFTEFDKTTTQKIKRNSTLNND